MKVVCIRIYRKYREIIDYIIVGGLTTVVSLGLFYGSMWMFWDSQNVFQLQYANILSWCGAVVFSYWANRVIVFKSSAPQVLKELLSFASSRVFTLMLDVVVMFAGVTILRMDYHIIKLLSMVLVTVGNYVISKFYVFKDKKRK